MFGKIKKVVNLVSNMGWRYTGFRARYELVKRLGLLKSRFPAAPAIKHYLSLADWKRQEVKFFFSSKESLQFTCTPEPALKLSFDNLKEGKLLLLH